MVQSRTASRSSALVDAQQVGAAGLTMALTASDAERRALAERCGLAAIEDLRADFELRREGRSGVHVTGRVWGLVTQTCVVTLEAFGSEVEADVDVHFLPEREAVAKAAEAARLAASLPEAERFAEDLPDAMVDGRIDLMALMEEFLTLGLDPYPRKPGAAFAEPEPDGPAGSPFAALARLRPERPN